VVTEPAASRLGRPPRDADFLTWVNALADAQDQIDALIAERDRLATQVAVQARQIADLSAEYDRLRWS
jgi:hypothetical protein